MASVIDSTPPDALRFRRAIPEVLSAAALRRMAGGRTLTLAIEIDR